MKLEALMSGVVMCHWFAGGVDVCDGIEDFYCFVVG